jgi:5-formyltetrahydrofolate cyclo-ligase
VQQAKATIRKYFLEIRKSLPEAEVQLAAVSAAANFIKFINIKEVKTIAAYYPVNFEINPINLMMLLSAESASENTHVEFALPIITNKNTPLLFRLWKPGDMLVRNSIYPHILEPLTLSPEVFPDLIILPLVAFDKCCNRLGYGGGFYDRTIARASKYKSSITVGYAYECQKSSKTLPVCKHDVPLDFVVTEKQVYSMTW